MSMTEFAKRKTMWRNGYYVVAYEIMKWSYDWELDPMCDCTPAQKVWEHTGEWRIDVHKAYINPDWKSVCTCRETACTADRISKDEAVKIWLNIERNNIPLDTVKNYFETATLTAESVRLMP